MSAATAIAVGPLPPVLADANARPFEHRAAFYQHDAELRTLLSEFVGDGLTNGDPVLVCATALHRQDLLERLQVNGFDAAALQSNGFLTLIDARDTLAAFMLDGRPHPALFRTALGALLDRMRLDVGKGPRQRIRIFGEMVNLLWADGQAQATIALEELWNDIGRSGDISLLCAYAVANFDITLHGAAYSHICETHTQVESGTAPREREDHVVAPADTDTGAIARETSQVTLLQAEIEHRKRLEQALQEALAQRRAIEDALRASQEELQRQNEDLSRTVRFSEMFVGILGHDLRNPLSAITTAASLLRKRADSDKVAKPASRILNSAGRMGRMIDQVLDFTRIRLGKGIPIAARELDLLEICRLALDELDSAGATRPVDLGWVGRCVGWWDGDRLSQMISNLVGNALTHGRAPDPVRVHVDGTAADDVVIEVHNAGTVPPEVLPTLFEPFGTSPTGKTAGSNGLGLGLYIGQQIVLAHQGTIVVTSSEADGTRFVVRLPRNANRLSAAAGEAGKQS